MLNTTEALGLGSICTDPRVRRQLQNHKVGLRVRSLLYRMREAIASVYDHPSDLVPLDPWPDLCAGIERLRVLACMTAFQKNVGGDQVEVDWEGPDMTHVTQRMISFFLQAAPLHLRMSLFTLSPGTTKQVTVFEMITVLEQMSLLQSREARSPDKVVRARAMATPASQYKSKMLHGRPPNRYRISRNQMFYDLLNAGVPKDKIDGIGNDAMFEMWKKIQTEFKSEPASRQHKDMGEGEMGTQPSAPTAKSPYAESQGMLREMTQGGGNTGTYPWPMSQPL